MFYRQIMMPCQTATITHREVSQVTDGIDPMLAERCSGVSIKFLLCLPQLLQGPEQICTAVGFVGNPDLLSLPLPCAARGGLATWHNSGSHFGPLTTSWPPTSSLQACPQERSPPQKAKSLA